VLVFGVPREIRGPLGAGAPTGAGFQVFAVDPKGQLVGTDGAVSDAPVPVRGFLDEAAGLPRSDEYRQGDARYIAASHPLPGGWALLVTQDAAAFDDGPTNRPAVSTAAALTAVFAVVFALLAWFDRHRAKAARQAEADRNAFLAIVGHELRTPLTVIKGYTDTLAARWDALDDASRRMLIENLAPQASRQARVIEHLLTAAALQAGTAPPARAEPVDVSEVVRSAVAAVERLLPLHHFAVDVDADVGPAHADPKALQQVLGELLDNAVRFSPAGGRVLVAARRRGRDVEITVEDEGVGLPSDVARLFLPFGQGEDVDRRVHAEGGIGVGLFIARALLERFGGSISAEPRRGDGARFVVSVPASRSRARAVPSVRGRP
jgi:signal transduction histidine kinase